MLDRFLEPGRIVKSIRGHDKGEFYMIVKAWDDGYVAIADGRARKLIKPKRKNPLHVRPTNEVLDISLTATDKQLRKALAVYRCKTNEEKEC